MTTTTTPTTTAELNARLVRLARLVVGCYDHASGFDPPNFDATGRATTAMAMWEILTGIEDGHDAITYARHVVAKGIEG
jgi:hypothetical protein